MSLLNEIHIAFGSTKKPKNLISTPKFDWDDLYLDASHFKNKEWKDVTEADWRSFPSAIFGFSPEGFCYFLPSIVAISVIKGDVDLVTDSIINLLDVSPDPGIWTDFFYRRFSLLTYAQLNALQMWVLWLSEKGFYNNPNSNNLYENDITCMRAYEVLEILKNTNHE